MRALGVAAVAGSWNCFVGDEGGLANCSSTHRINSDESKEREGKEEAEVPLGRGQVIT
jgi:hypothetical protein